MKVLNTEGVVKKDEVRGESCCPSRPTQLKRVEIRPLRRGCGPLRPGLRARSAPPQLGTPSAKGAARTGPLWAGRRAAPVAAPEGGPGSNFSHTSTRSCISVALLAAAPPRAAFGGGGSRSAVPILESRSKEHEGLGWRCASRTGW